ncbi:MAG: hypothetical protein ACI9VM_000532 [Candidatus Azotimanducaceae bacterium]|jgi:hypothetical protein
MFFSIGNMCPFKITRRSSLWALTLANVIPLLGVIFFDWRLIDVLFVFWFENVIIGFLNVFKMLRIQWAGIFFNIPFFVVHYGGFTYVHLIILLEIFGEDGIRHTVGSNPETIPLILSLIAATHVALLGLTASHTFSFFSNFLGKKEHLNTKLDTQMFKPYGRIVIMHITILIGGILAQKLGAPIIALVVLIGLKTVIDVLSHTIEHDKKELRN